MVLSLAVGAAFVLIAIGADYAVSNALYKESRLIPPAGVTPALLLALTAVCIAVFTVASNARLRARKTRVMEVAVAAPPQKQGAARLLPFVQEVRKYEPTPPLAPAPAALAPAPAPALAPTAEPEIETIGGARGSAAAAKSMSVREQLAELKAKGALGPQPKIVSQAPLEPLKIEAPKLELPAPAHAAAYAEEAAKKEKSEKSEKKGGFAGGAIASVFGKPKPPRYAKPQPQAAPTRQAQPRAPPAPQAPQAPQQKKGFLQRVFGGGGARAGAAGAAGAGQAPKPLRQPPKKPSEEQEIEVILSELHLVKAPAPTAPPKAKPGARRGVPPAAAAAAGAGAAAAAETGAQRHRLYLERRGAGAAGGAARFEEERREREELNTLFSDVYAQIEKPGKPGAARAAAQRGAAARGGAAGGAAAAGEKPLSMADLFGTEAAPAGAAPAAGGEAGAGGGSSVFSQLESLNAPKPQVGPQAGAAAAPQVQVVKMQVGSQAGCPHCGAKNVRVVFCPYCGGGMCANCTPSLKPTPEAFVYVCPKCGEEVPLAREKKA
jgi:predicted RNA-binding Zn-ribbon protein involved in translation (DUF1610 family)